MFAQVGEHVAQQRLDIAVRQQRRHAAQAAAIAGPLRDTSKPSVGQRCGFALGDVRLALADRDRLRHQQRLRAQAGAVMRGLELFVADALVRGVHVDDDQAVRGFGEDVDAVQLRDRVTQRRHAFVAAFPATPASNAAGMSA